MGLFHKVIGPLGYHKVDYVAVSDWTQSKCRQYQRMRWAGYKHFNSRSHLYAVYYHDDGSYTIYRKRK